MSTVVYYKATRPDATDFKTGRVHYEVGKRVRPEPFAGERRICYAGYLHAADVPAETLVGGNWPCRLFAVTGKPVVGFDDDHPSKGAFRQLTVVAEIPAYLALGPNGREVALLIDRAARLTADEARGLAAAWAAAWDAAWDAAWYAAWDAAWDAAWYAAAWDAARGAAWDAARGAAGDAAWYAAGALVVRDLITPKQFDLLYGPWRTVIEASS